jgi:formylglycine-generating enzyme required for sulfatase activity
MFGARGFDHGTTFGSRATLRSVGKRHVAPLLALVAGCGIFPDLSTLTSDASAPDAANDAIGITDGGAEASDASADVAIDGPTCTGIAGPVAVPAGTYCVDSTEVTNAQYNAWLATKPPLFTSPICSWKVSHLPDAVPDAGHDDYPVTWIDWCDAHDFCAWAGKRLCGAVDGGALPPSNVNTSLDAWHAACANAGVYPYGSTFDPTACNGPERDAGGALPATALPKCVGGFPGIFEMVGNVYEWVDSCTPVADGGPRADQCASRGGSFVDPAGQAQTCAVAPTSARNFTDKDIGFRCCADLK